MARMAGFGWLRCAEIALILSIVAFTPEVVQAQTPDWTLMIYLDADNDLESAGIQDFLEMAAVGSTDALNVVVLIDRIPAEDDSHDDWSEARRGRIETGDLPDAEWGEDLGEINMGDGDTVVDFVTWAQETYPAQHYALVLWDHGNGWWPVEDRRRSRTRAICWDTTDGDDALSIAELRLALDTIATTGERLDMVAFDACLMSMAEVAYEIADYADIMVGSENLVVGEGFAYDVVLEGLVAAPAMSATALGTLIADSYTDFLEVEYATSTDPMGMAVVDLAELPAVAAAILEMSTVFQAEWDADVDACGTAAGEVIQALDAALLYERHWPEVEGSYGLAVYFPYYDTDYYSIYNSTNAQFVGVSNWDDFLVAYFADMADSWVADIRGSTQEFMDTLHVDLYDFCNRVVEEVGADTDGDGVEDSADNCPYVANATQADEDDDGVGDICDDDTDNDGVADDEDGCPDDPDKTAAGQCGCGEPDTDTDDDEYADCVDDCPEDADKIVPGVCGCGLSDEDEDGDGFIACEEECPDDPNKTEAGVCGCGVPDLDTDGDETLDCEDECPGNAEKTEAGDCGCFAEDVDGDGDGSADCVDSCPADAAKVWPGVCGCGVSDADADTNGWPDCLENYGLDTNGHDTVLPLTIEDNPQTSGTGLCGAGTAAMISFLTLGLWCLRTANRYVSSRHR